MTAGPPSSDSAHGSDSAHASTLVEPLRALPAPDPVRVDPVLARYAAGLRPARRRYIVVVGIVLAVLLAGVTTAWLSGEGRATAVVTATLPEPAVANQPLGPTLSIAWASDDATAGGSTKTQGTIVTFGERAVRGRSALTGDIRWSYTRTDATVCDVVTQDGIAVAVFDKDGNCDEAVGLDAVTGERRWNRTLFDSGTSTMTSRTGSAMLVTATSVHVLSPGYDAANVPSGGLDRWYWAPEECVISAAQLGGRGVLASATCKGVAKLVMRKPYEDGEIWSVPESAQPLAVTDDAALGWDPATSTLIAFALDTGARAASATLAGCVDPVASEVAGMALVLCSGTTLYAFTAAAASLAQAWSMPAVALPVVQSTNENGVGQMVVIGPGDAGAMIARTIVVQTGAQLGGTPVTVPGDAQAAVVAASRIERNGAGLLVAGTSTMMLGGAG
ncbi:MAG: hypothetical protein JWN61_2302 [Pseudonocardiales bacterium]|nr:hypothetical protein [Pseudonocardiales bacterium]